MKVLIIGTGASSGTFAADGGVASFVRRLDAVHRSWRADYPNLARIVKDCVGPNGKEDELRLDVLWTRMDYFSKLRRTLGSEYGGPASIELHAAVLRAYSFEAERSRLLTATAGFTLKSALRELIPGDAIVSFNWDTVAETVASKMLHLTLLQAPAQAPHYGIRLIKPHGSLSWQHGERDGRAFVVWRDGAAPRLEPLPVETVRQVPGYFLQPLVIGAVPIKSELLEEVQARSGHEEVHERISDQWREVMDVISRATEVIVLGYGFPPEDAYGRFLFKIAAERRSTDLPPPRIKYYEVPSRQTEAEQALRDVFGEGVRTTYMGQVHGPGSTDAGVGRLRSLLLRCCVLARSRLTRG